MLKERLKWMAAWMVMALAVVSAIRYVPEVVTVSTGADGRELPIYCVDTKKPQIALSFDVVRGNEDILKILKILADQKAQATFFVTGKWAEAYPEDLKAIQEAGHDLGSLGENYRDMTKLSDTERTEELVGAHERVKNLTGVDMELFRPPYGSFDNDVARNAKENGYYMIRWSVDSMDWKDYGADVIAEAVCTHKNLDNGAIILCHSGAKYTARALESMVDGLQSQGYEIVPVSRLIYRENFHMDSTGKQMLN